MHIFSHVKPNQVLHNTSSTTLVLPSVDFIVYSLTVSVTNISNKTRSSDAGKVCKWLWIRLGLWLSQFRSPKHIPKSQCLVCCCRCNCVPIWALQQTTEEKKVKQNPEKTKNCTFPLKQPNAHFVFLP